MRASFNPRAARSAHADPPPLRAHSLIARTPAPPVGSDFSHWNSHCSLGDWLQKFNVPAIYAVDTRALTKKLREGGSILAKLEFVGMPVAFEDPNKRNLVAEVSTRAVRVFNKGATPRIVAIDCGIKFNIIRFLARTGMELTVVRALRCAPLLDSSFRERTGALRHNRASPTLPRSFPSPTPPRFPGAL